MSRIQIVILAAAIAACGGEPPPVEEAGPEVQAQMPDNVEYAVLDGYVGRTEMQGAAHRVEVYEYEGGSDLLVYGDEGRAFAYVYASMPFDRLPLGDSLYGYGDDVSAQLCLTGGGYDRPASSVLVSVEEDELGRSYTFDIETTDADWAFADVRLR